MSEQKSFMQELDLWSDANVVLPLASEDPKHEDWQTVVEQVKKAIRQKVLDSYRTAKASSPASQTARRAVCGPFLRGPCHSRNNH